MKKLLIIKTLLLTNSIAKAESKPQKIKKNDDNRGEKKGR